MSSQRWGEAVAWATASGTSVNTTAAETIIFPNVTIPANYMQDGRCIRIRAMGLHSTLGTGTVTLVFKLKAGGVAGTLLAQTGTITTLVSLANAYWDLDIIVQTRTNGATGTVIANGVVRVFGATAPTIGSATGAPAIAPMTVGGQTAPATATYDLTADSAYALTVTMGASSASNIVQGVQYTIESMN